VSDVTNFHRTETNYHVRAYIAASRRSDRCLEARVESARCASEIHKRRTGRSLRITEQDVMNEEIYEEEDSLPMQYRRLTAHLQTGSVDFNRRLAAYLTNQVAMQSALDQMVNNSYSQQYPNAPQFAHRENNMFPSTLAHQPLTSPTTSFRQAPYPSPHHRNFRPMHGHAYSIAGNPPIPKPGLGYRRLSCQPAFNNAQFSMLTLTVRIETLIISVRPSLSWWTTFLHYGKIWGLSRPHFHLSPCKCWVQFSTPATLSPPL
jgi:hypothetical protein